MLSSQMKRRFQSNSQIDDAVFFLLLVIVAEDFAENCVQWQAKVMEKRAQKRRGKSNRIRTQQIIRIVFKDRIRTPKTSPTIFND